MPVQLRMIRICINYPDANDYHCHYPAMQLPCQVIDNDYHLQSYRFHKLAHILHMHNPCQLPMQFLHISHAKVSMVSSPEICSKRDGEEPRKSMLHRTKKYCTATLTTYPR